MRAATSSSLDQSPCQYQRRGRGVRVWLETGNPLTLVGILVWVTAALHLMDLHRLNPDTSMPDYLGEGGPFQNLQLALLGWALLLSVLGIGMHQGDARGVFVLLVGPAFFLFWREADWDKDFLSAWLGGEGVRMFSWRYLTAGTEFPLRLKLGLGITSLGLTAFWLTQCWRFRASLRSLRQVTRGSIALFWLALAFLWLAAAQFPDRGWVPAAWRSDAEDGYLEEASEMLGELAWLLFVLVVWEALRKNPRPCDRR